MSRSQTTQVPDTPRHDTTVQEPWCCLCGQRHGLQNACDPERMKRLEEWRAHVDELRANSAQIDCTRAKRKRS
jgi:hypothetical protein